MMSRITFLDIYFTVLLATVLTPGIVLSQGSDEDQETSQKPAMAVMSSGQPVLAMPVSNMGKPGVLFYNLMTTDQVKVKFTVKCLALTTAYQLTVYASNHRVAAILGDSSYNVSCSNATESRETASLVTQKQTEAGSAGGGGVRDGGKMIEYTFKKETTNATDNSLYVGTVRGHFNVTLRARNIGRSFFVIIAEKLSGPDSAKSPDENGKGAAGGITDSAKGTAAAAGPQRRIHEDQVGLAMVVVMQLPRTIDMVFRIVLRCVIVMATAGMGLKVDVKVVLQVLKKPIGPIIGFFCQFICMPLIAYTVAKNVPQESAAVALGIFTCGVVPGGGVSNMFCFLLDGDVSLSVTMTTISNIAALGMTPLWIFTLGSTFQDDQVALKVPYLRIMETLGYVILPLFVGIFIQIKFPKLEKLISKVLKPVILVVVACTIALGVYTNIHIFRMIRPMAILAGCLLPYCGYLTGALVSLMACQTWKNIKTIAIETGIQNTGIAFMMLFLSLPPPDNQLATVGPAASAIMTPQPLFLTVIGYLIYKRCTKSPEDKEEAEAGDKKRDMVYEEKADEGVAEDLVPSKKKKKEKKGVKEATTRSSGGRWTAFMTGGSGKSAAIVMWEKLSGVKKTDLVGERLHQELIVPSPTSTTNDKEELWAESSWDARRDAAKSTNGQL